MNGAIAELWARIINTPKSSRTVTIGTSHQRLLAMKNESSSPAIPKRLVAVFKKVIRSSPRTRLHSSGKRAQIKGNQKAYPEISQQHDNTRNNQDKERRKRLGNDTF